MIPRFELKRSKARFEALKLLEKGSGEIDNIEVLKALIELATEKNLEIDFSKIVKEKKKNIIKSHEIILNMETVSFAIDNGFEVRPTE